MTSARAVHVVRPSENVPQPSRTAPASQRASAIDARARVAGPVARLRSNTTGPAASEMRIAAYDVGWGAARGRQGFR